jgi:hypothetical protein
MLVLGIGVMLEVPREGMERMDDSDWSCVRGAQRELLNGFMGNLEKETDESVCL